jgi:hypothetical protein
MNAYASTCFPGWHDNVLKTKGTMSVVKKGKEQLEKTRDTNAKIKGDLKIGAKATVQYESRATEIEVKAK